MHSTQLRQVEDLPVLGDFISPAEWSRDIIEASTRLFGKTTAGLLNAGDGSLVVVRGKDVRALSANQDAGNTPTEYLVRRSAERVSGPGQAERPQQVETAGFEFFLRNQVFTTNPPLNPVARRIFARQLMPRNVYRFAPAAERLLQEVIDECARHEQVEFCHDFAGRFVTRFWASQLGLTREQAGQAQRLLDEMNLMFLFSRTPEESRRMDAAATAYMDMVSGAVRGAWAAGDNQLLGEMAAELDQVDLPGKPGDVGLLVASNFFEGFHTVGVAIANVLFLLLSDPAAHQRVRAEPELVTNAFYEGVRLAPPLMLTHRRTLRDVEYDGLFIPEGTPIGMIWAAANRDPAVFDRTDSYDLTRTVQAGATFGGGVHLCPGRNAARMLTEVALAGLTAPGVEITLAGTEHAWVPDSGARQLAGLPVRLKRAGQS